MNKEIRNGNLIIAVLCIILIVLIGLSLYWVVNGIKLRENMVYTNMHMFENTNSVIDNNTVTNENNAVANTNTNTSATGNKTNQMGE